MKRESALRFVIFWYIVGCGSAFVSGFFLRGVLAKLGIARW